MRVVLQRGQGVLRQAQDKLRATAQTVLLSEVMRYETSKYFRFRDASNSLPVAEGTVLGVRWCFKLVTSFQQSLLNVQEFKVTGRQWILGTVERLKWIVDLLPCKGIERLLVLCRLRNLVKRDPAIISPQSRINCINHRLNP